MAISEEHLATNLSSILYSAGTDVGMRREENQDSYGIVQGSSYRLFIVADGMGGVQGGAVASNLAISSVEKSLREFPKCTPADLIKSIERANMAVHEKGQGDPSLSGMGTTFVSLLFTGSSLTVAHVGDSRAYRLRNNSFTRLTEDHTLVQELLRSGAITEEQAEHHPVAHMLTRSLGPSPVLDVDCELIQGGVEAGDRYLLCSDGLYNMVSEKEIGEIVRSHTTDDAVQILIDLANERGGTDNITVIIVNVSSWISAAQPSKQQSAEEIVPDDALVPKEEVRTSSRSPRTSKTGGYSEAGGVGNSENPSGEAAIEVPSGEPENKPSEILDELLESPSSDSFDGESQDAQEDPDEGYEEALADLRDDSEPDLKRSLVTRLPLLIGGFLGGLLVAYLFLGGKVAEEQGVDVVTIKKEPTPVLVAREIEEPAVDEARVIQELGANSRSIVPESVDVAPEPPVSASSPSPVSRVSGAQTVLGPSERVAVERRKELLAGVVSDIESKLAAFDRPLSGELAERLKDATRQAEETRTKLDQIRTDIDLATRRLGTWYERRRRLETTDAINMASEVGAVVPSVRQKKDEFERATWDYLKEVEAFHYSPGSSKEREAKLSELVRVRADKMKNLAFEVRSAIEKAIADIDSSIADLTLQRSKLEGGLDASRSELDFIRTITGSDDMKKQRLRFDLERQRETSLMELEELRKILPD